MESKLNHSTIENYSKTFSDNLISTFFSKKEAITGSEILEFFEVKQVNFFILKHLFENWKSEADHIKSPYFDYDHESVKKAFENFMNLLSKHIKIKKADFRPLLLNAVKDTILLICSPYDYYYHHIKRYDKNKIKVATLKENVKYMKVNKHLHLALVEKIEGAKEGEISSEQALQYLDEVIGNMSVPPEDFEEYERQFSKIAPLDVNKFYEETTPDASAEKTGPINNETAKTVNERYSSESKTLLDEISSEPGTTLVEMHQNKKIKSIKKHITINQRFMFVNELFDGDTNTFNQALEELERKDNYDQAIEYLLNNHAKKNDWLMDSDEVVEFLEVLNKRFV